MTPYRYEPQHHQEDQLIDRIAEEKGTPGIPIDSADFADDMERLTDFDCRVNLDEQIIKASGALATYEIHLDDDVVKWVS